jgi:transcriptional regulator with XRE-family HTH domain
VTHWLGGRIRTAAWRLHRPRPTRAFSRRPIEAAEITYLEALGAHLGAVRRDHRLTQAALGEASELSTSGIRRIETGTRRTRRSTLDRIAAALGDPGRLRSSRGSPDPPWPLSRATRSGSPADALGATAAAKPAKRRLRNERGGARSSTCCASSSATGKKTPARRGVRDRRATESLERTIPASVTETDPRS